MMYRCTTKDCGWVGSGPPNGGCPRCGMSAKSLAPQVVDEKQPPLSDSSPEAIAARLVELVYDPDHPLKKWKVILPGEGGAVWGVWRYDDYRAAESMAVTVRAVVAGINEALLAGLEKVLKDSVDKQPLVAPPQADYTLSKLQTEHHVKAMETAAEVVKSVHALMAGGAVISEADTPAMWATYTAACRTLRLQWNFADPAPTDTLPPKSEPRRTRSIDSVGQPR